MKECTNCLEVKEIDQFSPQKTNPKFLYAWCDACRKTANTTIKPWKAVAVQRDYQEMRRKAEQLRKFTPEQDQELARRYESGEKVPALAQEFGTNKNTVYKALKRARKM